MLNDLLLEVVMYIKYSPLYAESWNVAFRKTSIGEIIKNKKTKFNIIPNTYKYWAADPMIFKYNGIIYIFAELYDYKLRRGTIGFTYYDGNSFTKWKQIIVEDFHMSYPFIFVHKDNIYMIPETSEISKLILYKAVDFPEKWEKVKVIDNSVKWVDTTIYPYGEEFIGFTEEISEPKKDFMIKLNNNFEIISKTVVSEGSSDFRCAGKCFEYNDFLFRVCQDCSKKYGGALIFRKYKSILDEEIDSFKILPEELNYNKKILLDGMHTYSAAEDMEIIDIKTRRLNFINLFYRFIGKVKL